MTEKRSYLAAAFNARPMGMPIPPNWFGLAAAALLAVFVHPGFWLIGAGLEGLYLWVLSRNPRFRALVDAGREGSESDRRYETLVAHLDAGARDRQRAIEQQAVEIVGLLDRVGTSRAQIDGILQMAWLHLKLLAARASLLKVVAAGLRDSRDMAEQRSRIEQRLAGQDLDEELRRTLESQQEVILARQEAHADAALRRERIDAELDRLRQQVALVREQALLATDEQSAARSLDAVSASLNEANRWLRDEQELFAGLEDPTDEPPPQMLKAKALSGRRQGIFR